MSAAQLLVRLRDQGVRLWAEGERLRYQAPKEAVTPEVLTELARHKMDLLALLRGEPEPIRPVPRGGELPLSFNQQQLWLMAQLQPDSAAYNEAAILRLQGALDPRSLHGAIDEVVRRHEVLRTSFELTDGRPAQRIAPRLSVPLPLLDLTALPPQPARDEAERIATAEARRPFDLAHAPLLRLALVHLGPDEHVLVIALHHLIHDGESMKVLAGELAALYSAFRLGLPSPLPDLAIQYADYAFWQRRRVEGGVLAADRAYWRERLAGCEATLELPTDRPRPREPSFRGRREPWSAGPELRCRLLALARERDATLFIVLLSAFFALLHRDSGQDRIAVGNPRSGRDRLETAGLLGFIVNTRVLACDLAGDPTFAELLAQVRDGVLAAEAHAELPFELVVRELRPERSAGQNPLFQVMFAYQEDPRSAIRLPGLDIEMSEPFSGTAKFDLDLSLNDTGQRIEGFAEYATDLFKRATIKRLLGRYERLLAGMAEDLECRVWDLPLVSEPERRQLLAGWTDPAPRPCCLHELFAERARRHPQLSALSARGRELSYGEVAERVDRLRHALLARGLQPGQRAAVLLEDGLLQAPALLAVLAAGGAFLCLDPRAPALRQTEILAQARPVLLITERVFESALAPVLAELRGRGGDLPVLAADHFQDDVPDTAPEIAVDPASPCYVAFTSGSTGAPKGIVQSHASFAQFLAWQSECFAIGEGCRFAQWAAPTYDAAYCEIFGALCFGATLCVPDLEVRYDPRALLHWLRQERMSLLQIVPSFCRQLLHVAARQAARPGELVPVLERVLLAGEVLPSDLVESWLAHFGARPALFNLYGPTESVLATWHAVQADDACGPVPVGRAIAGRQILVLDRHGHLAPLGVRGEIFIRSPYLTMGYLDRPEETAAAFVADPLSGEAGIPAYRTGDLGRFRTDGELLFLGRLDQQVKIRGMRVEPGEIEAVLAGHPAVHECAVVPHEYGEGDRRLVAYVGAESDGIEDELARLARERLPDHMVPSLFVLLPRLTRTATGKLDRRALPRPAVEEWTSEERYVAPRPGLESTIAAVWEELLGLARVGIRESFFALGGNSLLAVQAVHRVGDAVGIELKPRDLWDQPTIAGLAERIEVLRASSAVEEDALRRLLADLQQLSDSEVRSLLTGSDPTGRTIQAQGHGKEGNR